MNNNTIKAALEKRFPGLKITIGPEFIKIGQTTIDYKRARELAR